MAHTFVTLLVLCAVTAAVIGQASQGALHTSQGGPHTPQGGPHETQGRVRRQVAQNGHQDGIVRGSATWTSCDVTNTPLLSCKDCSTRLVCKPVGGLVITCDDPLKPHCNRGICSAEASAECT